MTQSKEPRPMTQDEFRKRLEQLKEVITRGLSYYLVWKKLILRDAENVSWTLEQQNQLLGRYRGFFSPVCFALLDMALMQFAKMFDTDARTASLTNLLQAARKDSGLVPYASESDLGKISSQLKKSTTLLKTLKRKRDQDLSHVDANPTLGEPLPTKEFDKLADMVKSAFNTLSPGHTSWEHLLKTCEGHTVQVTEILLADMERSRQAHDEEMVGIALDEVRRREAEIGVKLNRESVHSVIQSLGLSKEQMQRVEKVHSSAV